MKTQLLLPLLLLLMIACKKDDPHPVFPAAPVPCSREELLGIYETDNTLSLEQQIYFPMFTSSGPNLAPGVTVNVPGELAELNIRPLDTLTYSTDCLTTQSETRFIWKSVRRRSLYTLSYANLGMPVPQGIAYQIVVEEKVMFDSGDPQSPVGNYLKVGDMTVLLRDRLNGKGMQHEGGYVFLPTVTVAGKTLTDVYTNTSAGSKYYVALDRGLVGYVAGSTEFAW